MPWEPMTDTEASGPGSKARSLLSEGDLPGAAEPLPVPPTP